MANKELPDGLWLHTCERPKCRKSWVSKKELPNVCSPCGSPIWNQTGDNRFK